MSVDINREELAWAAGWFDGEGFIGLRGRALSMAIPQTDPRPLRRFQSAVLGLGIIDGPWQPRTAHWKPKWTWRVQSFENVQAVVGLLWAFLSEPKREQARKALTAYAGRSRLRASPNAATCLSGHADWSIRPDGRRYCLTCYRQAHPGVRRFSPRTEEGC
jgi:hypothetical protein